MLAGAFDRKAESCQYPFTDKLLVVNNGVSAEGASALADAFPFVWFVERYINPYVDGELAAIDAADIYDYLCFVQGDCLIDPPYDWVTPGIKILEENPEISVVSPASAVNTWHDKNGLDRYCSDQSWLVRVEEFQGGDVFTHWKEHDPDYPSYAPRSFESLVGAYLKATGKYRKIIEEAWCQHPAY